MSAIRLATAANVREFQNLVNALSTNDTGYTLDHDALQDEIGRFRVWCGNIGALQKGHSSLDYRLRDSPLLSSNVLKLLQELENNITAASQIISGARLPYEKQQQQPSDSDDDEDDDFFSDDEDEDGPGAPKTELDMRFREILDVIDNLYKLSVRIRQPTIRSRSLKAAAFAPKDPETHVDLMEQYAVSDLQHIQELVRHLRMPYVKDGEAEDDGVLTSRFARAVTLRRRQFKYWKRHRDKLGAAIIHEEPTVPQQIERPEVLNRHDTLQVQIGNVEQAIVQDTPSQKTGRTLLSGTEATHYHQTLDDIVDSKSVTSYATTVRDATGRSIQLPAPPKDADGDRDFECPICYIICPSRYANQRAWKTHVLQDLQPYVCTYPECNTPDQLFQSRRQWVEHETSHRKIWRCPEHPDAIFKTSAGLSDHLRKEHGDSIPENQLNSIIKVGETSTIDMRACPICKAPEKSGQIANHIANHLERMAAFALPTNFHDDSDGASSQASKGGTESKDSQDLSKITFSSVSAGVLDDDGVKVKESIKPAESLGSPLRASTAEPLEADNRIPPAGQGLSAELLREVPNATRERLGILFTQKEQQANEPVPNQTPLSDNEEEDEEDLSTDSSSQISSEEEIPERDAKAPSRILTSSELPSLRSLYRSGYLFNGAAKFPPNDAYNRLISFYVYDITRLQVEAIVNSANRALKVSRMEFTLNRRIHKAAGPGLAGECKRHKKIKTGEAALTRGYNLPCSHVIHAARPSNRGGDEDKELLAKCYRNSLQLAMDHGIQSIAFPSLGSGGCGFSAPLAARVAVEEVRTFLDLNPSHPFTSIIFCPFSNADAMSYLHYIPIYFPPTDSDIEDVVPEDSTSSRFMLVKSVSDVCTQVEAVSEEMKSFRRHIAAFPGDIYLYLTSIVLALKTLKTNLAVPKEWLPPAAAHHAHEQLKSIPEQKAANVTLICAVMQAFCDSMTEIMEMAKVKAQSGEHIYQAIWNDYNQDMKASQRLDVAGLLELCHDFVHRLKSIVSSDVSTSHEMNTISIRLGAWLAKTTGREEHGIRQHFDEVMYTREFQRDAVVSDRSRVVKLQQLPTLTHLYQNGELKATLSNAGSQFNDIICFTNQDITRLEVDIIVNSSDPAFSGLSRLDHAVFGRAGVEIQEELSSLGNPKEGDVVSTGGYKLPAKHVLHAIPPERYLTSSKNVLRKIYRKILRQAEVLEAASIAIPTLGTGMLNYPRRDCALLAMEEIRRYLEQRGPNCSIEKIVFCVYSSSDESIYKAFLPEYFPSPDLETENEQLGKYPIQQIQRPLEEMEENALINFERHAETCLICIEVEKVYNEGGNLCGVGYGLAQVVLQHLNMDSSQTVLSTKRVLNRRVQVDVPQDFPLGLEMLTSVERSFRNPDRNMPFVSVIRPWPGLAEYQEDPNAPLPGVTIHQAIFEIPKEPEKSHAFVCTWSEEDKIWEALHRHACVIHIFPGKIQIYEPVIRSAAQVPLLSLELTPEIPVQKTSSTEITIEKTRLLQESVAKTSSRILLRCVSPSSCEILYQILQFSAKSNSTYNEHRSGIEASGAKLSDAQQTRIPDGEDTASIPKPNKSKEHTSPWTVPNDMWICGVCHQGADLIHTRCPVCSHVRDATDFGPGQIYYDSAHEDLSFSASVVLNWLRILDEGDGVHFSKLAAKAGVTDAILTKAIQELWEYDLIHPTPENTGAWSATAIPKQAPDERGSGIETLGAQPLDADQQESSKENEATKNDGIDNLNTESLSVEAKLVSFRLLLQTSHQGNLAPFRINVLPHDTIDSILAAVKTFWGLDDNMNVTFMDGEGNMLILTYDNLTHNGIVYVHVVSEQISTSEPKNLDHTVPDDKWVCSICNLGYTIPITSNKCPQCGHHRDAVDAGAERRYSSAGVRKFSTLSYVILSRLRSLPERTRGMHQDSLSREYGVTKEDVTNVLRRLQIVRLIHPVEGVEGVWAATEPDQTSTSLSRHFHSYKWLQNDQQTDNDEEKKEEGSTFEQPFPNTTTRRRSAQFNPPISPTAMTEALGEHARDMEAASALQNEHQHETETLQRNPDIPQQSHPLSSHEKNPSAAEPPSSSSSLLLQPKSPSTSEDIDLYSYLTSADLPPAPNPAKPRPNTPETENTVVVPAVRNLDEINTDDYYTYVEVPGTEEEEVWTMIDGRVVGPEAVAEVTSAYEFKSEENSVVVRERLTSRDVRRLAERTVEIRKGME
ncbi:hypothetical protein DM02DRAFT_652592 [Periconia macrospinosa]|uniref:Uncharacterized protein n=1 Tax=Periconia macrospinosa TaxID=97972 RepID=A0A2V1E004_9PLEO|nr:hypothetical protein DM02DRAFT_652592 [Periconia macrospinosa]